jgi:hypothetical protein
MPFHIDRYLSTATVAMPKTKPVATDASMVQYTFLYSHTSQSGHSNQCSVACDIVFILMSSHMDRLCGLVVRVIGYRFGGPGSIPGTTRKKKVVGLERGHSAS